MCALAHCADAPVFELSDLVYLARSHLTDQIEFIAWTGSGRRPGQPSQASLEASALGSDSI